MTPAARRRRAAISAVAAVLSASWPHFASAYTAAGDRTFPATILLPPAAPADQLFLTPATQPGTDGRVTDLSLNFSKTLTERLGVRFEEGYSWLGRNGAPPVAGWQNLVTVAQYLAVRDAPGEGLVSLGVAREWGGTGTRRIGASAQGATTPTVYFAKGLGDLDLGCLRPIAVTGSVGYQFADAPPRPDNLLTGIALEYSIPYLQSKVRTFALPELLRGLTPLVEAFVANPTSNRGGKGASATFGPGVNYSGGGGWEVTIEALVPAGRGAGAGLGVVAQFNMSLDYFFPDSVGKPLFSGL